MKRDWDVIRSLLEEVERQSGKQRRDSIYALRVDQSTEERAKVEHIVLLEQAGFLTCEFVGGLDRDAWDSLELTWAGHDLLDTIRSQGVWNRIKAVAKTKGIELTFDAVKSLGKYAMEEALKA